MASAFTAHNVLTRYIHNFSYSVLTMKRVCGTTYLRQFEISVQVERLRFPEFILCPKTAGKQGGLALKQVSVVSLDTLNRTLVMSDLKRHVGEVGPDEMRNLLAFAVGGAGLDNMDPLLDKLTDSDLLRLQQLFLQWTGGRSLPVFYDMLFNRYGYTCNEVSDSVLSEVIPLQLFANCQYGGRNGVSGVTLNCCDLFRPYYVMLRGKCFALRKFYQYDPNHRGSLNVIMNQLPSVVLKENGLQVFTACTLAKELDCGILASNGGVHARVRCGAFERLLTSLPQLEFLQPDGAEAASFQNAAHESQLLAGLQLLRDFAVLYGTMAALQDRTAHELLLVLR